MEEKTRDMLIAILAVMLAVSIFFNGWLLHEKAAGTTYVVPENSVHECFESEECTGGKVCCAYPCQHGVGVYCSPPRLFQCMTAEECQQKDGKVL